MFAWRWAHVASISADFEPGDVSIVAVRRDQAGCSSLRSRTERPRRSEGDRSRTARSGKLTTASLRFNLRWWLGEQRTGAKGQLAGKGEVAWPGGGHVLPFAFAGAVSPIPIVAVILMLLSTHPASNSPAFLLGWVVGLTIVVVAVLFLARGTSGGPSDPSRGSRWQRAWRSSRPVIGSGKRGRAKARPPRCRAG